MNGVFGIYDEYIKNQKLFSLIYLLTFYIQTTFACINNKLNLCVDMSTSRIELVPLFRG